MSGPTDSQVQSLRVPETTDKQIVLNLIIWDALGLTTVVTQSITMSNNSIISAFEDTMLLYNNYSDPEHHQNLLQATRVTLENLTDATELAYLNFNEKLTAIQLIVSSTFSVEASLFPVLSESNNWYGSSPVANAQSNCSLPCQNNGSCTKLWGSAFCKCESGFSGYFCQYPEDIATMLQTLIYSGLSEITDDNSISFHDFAQGLAIMNPLPDLISGDISELLIKANKIYSSSCELDDLMQLGCSLKWSILTYASEFLRNVGQDFAKIAREIIPALGNCDKTLKSVMKKIAKIQADQSEDLDDVKELSGANMRYAVKTIDSEKQSNISFSDPASNIKVAVPPAVLSNTSLSTLRVIYTSTNDNPFLFSNQTVSASIISPIVTLSFVDNSSEEVPVSHLADPILLTFPIPRSSQLHQAVSYVTSNPTLFRSNLTEIFANHTGCRYWNTEAGEWSGAGLTLVSISLTSFTCASTHATDFVGVFFDDGLDTFGLDDPDHPKPMSAWEKLRNTPLFTNWGFILVLALIVSYFVILAVLIVADNKKVPQLQRQQILDDIKDKKSILKKRKFEPPENSRRLAYDLSAMPRVRRHSGSRETVPAAVDVTAANQPDSQNPNDSNQNLPQRQNSNTESVNNPASQQTGNQNSNTSMELNHSVSGLIDARQRDALRNNFVDQAQVQLEESNLSNNPTNPTGTLPEVIIRINREKPARPLTFCQYWGEDLLEHHATFNCIVKTSRISPRHARATLLYFTFVCNFTFCAMLYPKSGLGVDTLSDVKRGFGIGLQTGFIAALCSCVPAFIVSIILKAPKRAISRLKHASVEEFNIELKRIAHWMKFRYGLAYGLLAAVSTACFVYILLFCAAKSSEQSTWLTACVMSLVIDQFCFELLPGLVGGLLYQSVIKCRSCKALLKVEVLIVTIRCYKTLNGY